MTTNFNEQDRLGMGTSLQWQASLNDAIQAGDDQRLWWLLAQHDDQAEAHHKLATQVARLAYAVGGKPRFAEMFAVPVIDSPDNRVIESEQAWKAGSICIGEALDSWLPSKVAKTVFAGIRPYDWIGTWRPGILRSHLHSIVPGSGKKGATFLTNEIDLPDTAPRLGFLCMVLTHERGWPQLPQADTLRDNRFKSVVAMALQSKERAAAPQVLAPDRLQFAVADGLCLWLHLLNEVVPIRAWMAAPSVASPDVVKITLELEDEQVRYTQFTLRKHQIGLDGVDGVLSMLQAIAPTMDTPMDKPERQQKDKTVALT